MIYKREISGILFLISLVLCLSLSAGSIELQLKLDSLLIAGDFKMANDLLDKSSSLLLNDSKQNYLKILNDIKKIDTVSTDSDYINELVQQYKNNEKNFHEEYAGEESNISYRKFLSLAKNDDNREAIKYYLVADFLKAKHIKNTIYKTKVEIEKAQVLYNENKITEALNTIDSINLITGKNLKLNALNDTIYMLKEKILKRKSEQETHKLMWKQKEKVDYAFKLSVGGTIGSNYPLENEILRFDPGLVLNKYGFSVIGNLSLYKRFSLGLDLTLAHSSYSSGSLSSSPYFYNFNAYSRSIQAYIEFLLRDQAGARPHINFGIGYLHLSSESSTATYTVIVYDNGHSYSDMRYYSFPEMTFTTLQILTEFGIEYIPSNTTRFVIGSKLSTSYNTRDIKALDQFNISFSLNTGIVFK